MDALNELWSYLTTAENWWGNRGIVVRTWDHVRLSGFSVLVASLLALPPAVVLGHLKKGVWWPSGWSTSAGRCRRSP